MWKTVARRLLILIPQLLVISFFMFLLALAMPGDALTGSFALDPNRTQAELEALRVLHGLDLPWYQQYFNWITGIITRLDFGSSVQHFMPVTAVIGQRAIQTFWLSLWTLVVVYSIAIPLGIAAGRWKGKIVDRAIMIYTFVALAMPTIVLGIVLIFAFSFNIRWFPSSGSVDVFVYATGNWFDILLSRIHHMTLPVLTGALIGTIGIIYMLRANIIERAYSEYVVLARSKGVPTKKVFSRHILRNSLIPIASSIGIVIIVSMMGSIFVETIFQYPGMGLLFIQSVTARDMPVANALIMLFAVLTAIGILLSDIILTIVDPRIRIK